MSAPPAAPAPGQPAVLRFAVPFGDATLPAALAWAHVEPRHEFLATTAASWLAGSEHARFRRFAVDSACADFLAGRIAAKAAVQALDPSLTPGSLEIVGGVWEQPCLRPAAHGLAVTLAHAAGLGVALACDDRWLAGIDLETVGRADRAIIATVVTAGERDWADGAADAAGRAARWTLLWTGREALGKLLRAGIARPGLLPPLESPRETDRGWHARFQGAEDIGLHAVRIGTHVLALVAPATLGAAETIGEVLDRLPQDHG